MKTVIRATKEKFNGWMDGWMDGWMEVVVEMEVNPPQGWMIGLGNQGLGNQAQFQIPGGRVTETN